jgi:hypothetical protein
MGGQSLGYLEQKISSTVNETRGGATAFKAYQTSLANCQPALDCPRPPAPLSVRLLVWVLQPAPCCCCCCCCCCCRPRSQSAPSGRTVSYPSPSGASTIILPTPAEHWRISRLVQLAGLTRDGKPAHVQRIRPWRRRHRVLNSAVCDAAVSLPDMLQWVGSAVVQRVANRPMRTWMSIFDHQARCAIHHPSPIARPSLPSAPQHKHNLTTGKIKPKHACAAHPLPTSTNHHCAAQSTSSRPGPAIVLQQKQGNKHDTPRTNYPVRNKSKSALG